MVMKSLTATSQRRMPENGGTTARLTKLAKTQRRIKDLQAKIRYLQKEGWTGAQPLKVCGQAAILAEKLDRLVGAESGRSEEGEVQCPHDLGEIGSDLHEDKVAQLGKYVENQNRNEMKHIKAQRLAARKQELRVDWTTGGGKLCYKAAREQGQPPTLVLSRQDGTLTADPGELHALVEKVMGKGRFQ